MMPRALAPAGVPFFLGDIFAALRASWRGRQSIEDFRRELADFFNQEDVFFYSSGRGAVRAGLQALHSLAPDRDEVAVPAFTSFSVPSAVVNAGFKVCLYDVDPETMSPDMESLKRAVNDKTLCIMVCHLYGCPVDMDPVLAIARERHVPVFDDAAQAMGAQYKNRLAGTMGDLGLFSLSRGKNISAVDGGVLVTNHSRLAGILKAMPCDAPSLSVRIRTGLAALALCFLLYPGLYWIPSGMPFLRLGESRFDPEFTVTGLTAFQAGLGLRMFRRLAGINAARKDVAGQWMEKLNGRRVPRVVSGGESVWLRLPVLDGVDEPMPGMGVVPAYPASLNAIEDLKPYLRHAEPCPGAETLARAVLTLPTHCYVRGKDIDIVTRAMAANGAG